MPGSMPGITTVDGEVADVIRPGRSILEVVGVPDLPLYVGEAVTGEPSAFNHHGVAAPGYLGRYGDSLVGYVMSGLGFVVLAAHIDHLALTSCSPPMVASLGVSRTTHLPLPVSPVLPVAMFVVGEVIHVYVFVGREPGPVYAVTLWSRVRLLSGVKVIVGSGTVSVASPTRPSSSVIVMVLSPSVTAVRNIEADYYPSAS